MGPPLALLHSAMLSHKELEPVVEGLAVAMAESTNETATVLGLENTLRESLGGRISPGARSRERSESPTTRGGEEAPQLKGTPPLPAPPTTGTFAAGTVATTGSSPALPEGKISIDDFAKIELRVAQVKVAERVPKADKLLRLEVDLGYETRQILAGIAESYTPESLIGRKVVIVANLAPRKLRGFESNGMIVAASTADGKAVLAGFLEDVEIGAKLK